MLISQVTVLVLNTPKPKSMSALGTYFARVKWNVAWVLLRTRYSLPQCTQNLIWACAQTDCSLPKLDHQSCSFVPPDVPGGKKILGVFTSYRFPGKNTHDEISLGLPIHALLYASVPSGIYSLVLIHWFLPLSDLDSIPGYVIWIMP